MKSLNTQKCEKGHNVIVADYHQGKVKCQICGFKPYAPGRGIKKPSAARIAENLERRLRLNNSLSYD